METLNNRIEFLEKEINEIKQDIKDMDLKIEKTEINIMTKVEKNQSDIKEVIKMNDENIRKTIEKFENGLNKLSESQYQQTLIQKDIQNDLKTTIREFTELSKEMKDNDKWKTRTIAGFVVSFILMILGTFWNMVTQGIIH